MLNFYRPAIPKFIKRAAQAARYTFRGDVPNEWMSVLNPMKPFTPVQAPWQYDRPVGYNLFYKPRGTEKYTFEQLKYVARHSELVRLAITTRKDQVSSIKWDIKPRETPEDETEAQEDDPDVIRIKEFFAKPDRIHDYDQWVRILLEVLFVTDGVALARQKMRGGELLALEPIDPATIFPLIDQNGRTPLPPDPAYQQILKGQPKADYTMDELIYYIRDTQVDSPYGYSAVEQVVETAYTDIERIKYTLAAFTEGTVPDAYITAPENMSSDKVLAYQEQLNNLLAGNAAGRRQMPILVYGMEIKSMKQAELKNDFDEWIARKVCFAFSLPPTAFVKQLNRSTGETAKETAKDEGLFPLLLYLKRLFDRVIKEDFNRPDLEWYWDDDEEKDPKVQAEIHCMYVKEGIFSRNEIRDELGAENVTGGDEPMVDTASGPVPLPGSPLDKKMKADQQKQADATAAQAHENNMAVVTAKGGQSDDVPPGNGKTAKMIKKKDRFAYPLPTQPHIH